MKLFNAIAIYDVYVVAESSEAARTALLSSIQSSAIKSADGADDGIRPMEITATETLRESAIRQGFRDERPFVAMDVSDEDFEKCKGKTTIQMFETIYTKQRSKG